jgi:hypothetical protein
VGFVIGFWFIKSRLWRAKISNEESAIKGMWREKAKALAAALPMRKPVYDPGPADKATARISDGVMPSWLQRSLIRGKSVAEWLLGRLLCALIGASMLFLHKETLHHSVPVSIHKITFAPL